MLPPSRRWASEDAKKAAPPTRNRDYSVKEDETVMMKITAEIRALIDKAAASVELAGDET